ncbi:MAG: 50S ribosomal protein L20 [Lachnospiraceae bacterium]|nr:50S ribosomal protein L20 [Lachnospiraceae bacterium]
MARVKGALNARKRHKKVLKLARGYRGARSKQYRIAKQSVMKAMAYSFAGRKQTKREYRRLWIARINAAARMNGLSYSKMMHGLKLADININRKMLADLAVTDAAGFAKLAEAAKAKL